MSDHLATIGSTSCFAQAYMYMTQMVANRFLNFNKLAGNNLFPHIVLNQCWPSVATYPASKHDMEWHDDGHIGHMLPKGANITVSDRFIMVI